MVRERFSHQAALEDGALSAQTEGFSGRSHGRAPAASPAQQQTPHNTHSGREN